MSFLIASLGEVEYDRVIFLIFCYESAQNDSPQQCFGIFTEFLRNK
jgi:hypothetical protein